MSLKFVPPTSQNWKYGVWVDGHGFRVKSNLGAAKQSAYAKAGIYDISSTTDVTRNRVVITEQVDGEWYTLFDVPAGTPCSEIPWRKQVPTRRYNYDRRVYEDSTKAKSVSMTREEYAEWRIKVDRERQAEIHSQPVGR
jgi:hypothetical protein